MSPQKPSVEGRKAQDERPVAMVVSRYFAAVLLLRTDGTDSPGSRARPDRRRRLGVLARVKGHDFAHGFVLIEAG